MTSKNLRSQPAEATRKWFNVVLIVNLVVMFFPPIHLGMANGDMSTALLYFFGSPVLVVVSLFVLAKLDPAYNEE